MDRHTRKRNKALTCSFFAILTLIFFFVSCDSFYKPVEEWFDYYTNTAGIMDFSVPESTCKYNGMHVIESNGDKEVYFYLRNPKKYQLVFQYSAGDEIDNARVEFAPEPDPFNSSMAKIILSHTTLEGIERFSPANKNISGTINISSADGIPHGFPSFYLPLFVNSAPPRIQGAMYQRNKSAGEDGTEYIICFNIPKMFDTVHQNDTKDLYIGSEHFRIDSSNSTPTITDAEGNPTTKLSTTEPSDLKDISGEAAVFATLEGCVQYYYHTGIRPEDSDEERKCKISLVDDYNFKKEVIVSSQMAKLEKPYINVNETKTVREIDGKYDLVISHSGIAKYKTPGGQVESKNCSSPVIEYKIYKVGEASNPFKSGSGRAPVKIPLDKGKYYVKAYAQAEGFADGEEMDGYGTKNEDPFIFFPCTTYYVKNSGSSNNNGSKNYPYSTIDECVEQIKADKVNFNPGDFWGTFIIRLSSNLVLNQKISVTDLKKQSCVIDGGGYTINSENSFDNLIEISPDPSQGSNEGFTLRLQNLNITANECSENVIKISNDSSGIMNVDFYNCLIKNNTVGTGYAVKLEGNVLVVLRGNTNITANKDDSENNKNFYLPYGKYLSFIDGVYFSPAQSTTPFSGRVGITTENDPQIGNAIQLTQNFDQYKASGLSPYTAFTPDSSSQGCIVYDEDTGEVYLSASSSSFTTYAGEKITVSCTGSASADGGKITVAVNNEAGDSITSQCTFSAHMITYMSHPLGNNDNYFFTPNGNKITLKNTVIEKGTGYALYVQITYNGFTYDATLPFAVN
ncbi:MAG: hypothetical protein IK002_07265 [Treponema sp.]|uniref:hypothetical protein n=1 Tax=Treponema sp. TaxID=166 RepID=UPI00298DDF5F|nr:hypothetical protein [Treponema sp.]MBR5933766.1 hypothetical protein [Treponema sp.]